MSRSRWIARVLFGAMLLAALPGAVAAEPISPVLTFTMFPSSTLPAESVAYEVQVTPAEADGAVELQISTDDGETWEGWGNGAAIGDGRYAFTMQSPTQPVTRRIRARFMPASGDWADAESEAQTQVVAKQASSISDLTTESNAAPTLPGSMDVDMWVNLSGIGAAPGLLTFEQDIDGSWVTLGVVVPHAHADSAGIDITGPLGEGTHTIRVSYAGDGQSTPSSTTFELEIARMATEIHVQDEGPVDADTPINLWGSVVPVSRAGSSPSGLFTISEDGTVLASSTASGVSITLPARPAGTYVFTFDEAGDVNFLPSSVQHVVTVLANAVHATANPLSLGTFYPHKDGYKDSTRASGTRDEPASATFSVKSAAGKVVRTASVAIGTGAYHWTWNGRTASGKQVKAGTYTVVTVLRDAAGTRKTVSQAVKVSAKSLHQETRNLYRTGRQTERQTKSWGAWKFKLPSAFAYGGIRVYVKGHATRSVPPAAFGPHSLEWCPFSKVDWTCTGVIREITPKDTWRSLPVDANARSGRHVRVYVWAGRVGTVVVDKVRLRVKYTVLR